MPVLPWLLIFGFVWFFVYRQLRNRYQSAWDKHPDLHRPHVLEIDDEGLSWSTQVSNSRRLWEGYTSWDETKNLFLLYRGELLVEFIPKRAIADVASFDQVRELLRRSISPPQHAFPVIR